MDNLLQIVKDPAGKLVTICFFSSVAASYVFAATTLQTAKNRPNLLKLHHKLCSGICSGGRYKAATTATKSPLEVGNYVY
ncbi:MAG: hypothetical protein KAI50_02685 [Desulfobacterales bacterium]|nr:hypothetical protein [Desulfobacterales bacterium]